MSCFFKSLELHFKFFKSLKVPGHYRLPIKGSGTILKVDVGTYSELYIYTYV